MITRGYKRLLALAGMATVIVAPLGVLAMQADDSSSNQTLSSSTPKIDSPTLSDTPVSTASSAANTSKTSVTINGQQISLSPNGQTRQVIQNAHGTTTIDVSVSNKVSGNVGSSQSSNNISFSSNSVTSVNGQSEEN